MTSLLDFNIFWSRKAISLISSHSRVSQKPVFERFVIVLFLWKFWKFWYKILCNLLKKWLRSRTLLKTEKKTRDRNWQKYSFGLEVSKKFPYSNAPPTVSPHPPYPPTHRIPPLTVSPTPSTWKQQLSKTTSFPLPVRTGVCVTGHQNADDIDLILRFARVAFYLFASLLSSF